MRYPFQPHGIRATCLAIAAAFTFLAASPAIQAQQAAAFAAGEPVRQIVAQLQKSIEQIISDLEGTYSRSAFDTRTDLIALIQQLQLSADATSGKTFGELDKLQQHTFANIQSALFQWNAGNRASLAQLSDDLNQLNSALATLPLANTWPRVLRYTPSFIVGTKMGRPFSVSIIGSWLGSGTPTLQFGTRECILTTKVEFQLQFSCQLPTAPPPATKPITDITGKLTVQYRNRGLIDSLKEFFGFGQTRTYYLGIAVISPFLATYSGAAIVSARQLTTKARNGSCIHHNDHCAGSFPLTCGFTATSGWQIDPNSIHAQATSVSKNSHFDGVFDVTTNGFQVRGTVANSGECKQICVPVAGCTTVAHDGRGQITSYESWLDTKWITRDTTVSIPPGNLYWGDDVTIALPRGASGITLTLQRVDGHTDVITKSGQKGWITAEFRQDQNLLILHPLAPQDALAQ